MSTSAIAAEGIKTILHPVSDLGAAKAFYTTLLGAEATADSEYYVGFDVGGQHLGLLPNGGDGAPVAYWAVPDIEGKVQELLAAGATAGDAIREVGGGRRVATVVDADGNVIGLLQDA
jgi:predicted enzyme related to lactoylglutathione lyase